MPVNTEHPDYGKHIKQWDKCLHFYGGEDEVKAQGEMYLPCLKDGEDEYPNYKARAHFFDAFARTVQGLRGTMNRKPHIWEPELNDLPMPPIPEIDNHLLMYGRVGVLVDFDDQNRVPYYAIYRPQDIINWNTTGVGENERPNLIVLREMAHVMGYRTEDEFGYGVREVYRVLRLDETGLFFSQTYEKLQNAPGYAVTDPIYPDGVQGKLNYIPFVCLNARTLGFTVEPPPLIGLVNLMWHYYLSSADLQAGRHKCGLPILWSRGFPDSTLMLGSSVAYNSTDPNAQVFYTELGGNALVNLERDLEECKLEAAILGSRMLEGTRPGVETAETTRIRQSGRRRFRRQAERSPAADPPTITICRGSIGSLLSTPRSLQGWFRAFNLWTTPPPKTTAAVSAMASRVPSAARWPASVPPAWPRGGIT
jgi:hypothetical protein